MAGRLRRMKAPLVVVADRPERARRAAALLRRAGRGDVRYLTGSMREWAADPTMPLEALPRYRQLVNGRWLRKRDTTVIVYGRPSVAAARFAWTLLYAGVEDVRILDGGQRSWIEAGGELETRTRFPSPALSFGGEVPARPDLKATCASVRSALGNPDQVVADTRTWPEYLGQTSLYADIPTRGRIAGARWAHAGSDVQSMQDYEDDHDGSFRSHIEVEDFWRRWGICSDRRVVFYCGTGWRASLAFLHAWLMGWPRIQLFDSGWMEWSMGPDAGRHPVETGEP